MTLAWPFQPIADVCHVKPQKSEARARVSNSSLVSFLPMEQLGIDQKFATGAETKPLASVSGSYTYFADGDVLLAKITPCFENGKLGIARNLENGIGFGSSEYIVLRPQASLSSEWLYYFLARDSFRAEGAPRMTGAVGHKRVPKEFVETYRIPMPSIEEQHRIVAVLDNALESIAVARANAEKNLQNARELFESAVDGVFSRRSEGSISTSLLREVELLCGFAFKSSRYSDSVDDVKLLRGDNVMQGYLRWDDVKRWPTSEVENYESYRLQEGDVVLAMDRPWVSAGLKRSLISRKDLPALLVQRVARLRCRSRMLAEFLEYLIGSQSFVRHILGAQTGIGVPHVSGQQIQSFTFEMPDKSDQRLLVDRLGGLKAESQRMESVYQRKLTALDELKQSLLHQAFSGQL